MPTGPSGAVPDEAAGAVRPHRDVPIPAVPTPEAPANGEVQPTVGVKVDGEWKLVLASPAGPQPMGMHLQSAGNAVTGYLSSSEGEKPFTGTMDGNRIKFDLKVTKPMSITLKYDLAIDGDTIAGTCKMGIFGKAKVRGQRA